MKTSPYLSKSLLNNYRQCPRRLWLEMRDRQAVRNGQQPQVHAQHTADTLKRFAEGHVIGRIAQAMWPQGVDIEAAVQQTLGPFRRDLGLSGKLTQQAVAKRQTMFEATFSHSNVLVQADVLLPVRGGWQMLEVKSSGSVKDYHITDLATQVWVAERCGITLKSVGLVLVNKEFELQTLGDYTGLLQVHDGAELQIRIRQSQQTLPNTVRAARRIIKQTAEPVQHAPGEQCNSPFACPYQDHCSTATAKPSKSSSKAVPIRFYMDMGLNKACALKDEGYTDLRKVPKKRIEQLWDGDTLNHRLNRRLAEAVRTGRPVIDREGLTEAFNSFSWPVQHLDFETINFAAPVWPGVHSGQQVPFQYSVHVQERRGKVVSHHEFLDASGNDPRRALAEKLLQDLHHNRTILAWNASFERRVIHELAQQFADLASGLMRLHAQVQDLLSVVRNNYAHPDMAKATSSMFSIKTVLPLLAPSLSYDQLDGVQNGGDAQATYLRVAAPELVRQANGYTEAQRQQDIANMLKYCEQDTYGMAMIYKGL
jgi:hypothetical protein